MTAGSDRPTQDEFMLRFELLQPINPAAARETAVEAELAAALDGEYELAIAWKQLIAAIDRG